MRRSSARCRSDKPALPRCCRCSAVPSCSALWLPPVVLQLAFTASCLLPQHQLRCAGCRGDEGTRPAGRGEGEGGQAPV